MNVLLQSNQRYLELLGANIPNPSKKHRLITYLQYYDVDHGKAIYNYLTRSFIWIPYEQFDRIFNDDYQNEEYVDYMWRNFFIVNEDFNEQEKQQLLKDKDRPNQYDDYYLKSGEILEYTIFTTMACNARCAYCYEKGRPQVPMTSKTANEVADYIIRSAQKTGKKIALRWFGGEPLVGEHVIDIICQKVKDAGYDYYSSFTTNGFLLKEEKIKKYKDLWHFSNCQITIDGTEENYNKIKNYKNVKGKNPFQIVMNNVQFLADNNIGVSIRMNMDLNNAEDIKKLIKYIYDRFGNNNYVSPYAYVIFDSEDDNNMRSEEECKMLYDKLDEINDLLTEYGYTRNKKNPSQYVRSAHCMIDHGRAVVIGTNGDLGLCEHYSEEHFWGHINKPEMKNMDEINIFKEYEKDLDICKNCPILPDCIRPKLCHALRRCNEPIKNWHIREAQMGMENLYHNIMNSNNNRYKFSNNCNNCNNICNDYSQNNFVNENNKCNIPKLSFFDKLKIKLKMK